MAKHDLENRLKHYREQFGLSQVELAVRSGLSRSEISAIETGRLVPSTTASLKLAEVLACSVEDLFAIRRDDRSDSQAWPGSFHGRYWRAEVNGAIRQYPAETLGVGTIPSDELAPPNALEARSTLVIASCDPAIGILCRHLERQGVRCLPFNRSSRKALELLRSGVVHIAGLHLGHDSEENARYVLETLGEGYVLVHVAKWEDGLAFSKTATPGSLSSRSLSRMKWVGREPGSGARKCSDSILGPVKAAPTGYDHFARDHRGVVESILTGWADVGVCLRLIAEEAGLPFKSVASESFDFCLRQEHLDDMRVRAFIQALESAEFRKQMGSLAGYNPAQCGERLSI